MTGIDWIIILVLLVSALISYFRGFFREVINLAVWVAAVAITLAFTANFASLLPIETVEKPQARLAISAGILFFSTLLVGGLANWLSMKIVEKRRKKPFDRVAGIVFGLLRGLIIVSLLVLLSNLTPNMKQEKWWRNSAFIPALQYIAKGIHRQLPDEVAQHFSFSSVS